MKKSLFRRYWIGRGSGPRAGFFLIKPLTYMNRSGEILHDVFKQTNGDPQKVLVVCDTVDLPVGSCRLKTRGSSAGQKGLASIIKVAGTDEIPRLFIGIGRPEYQGNIISYVLGKPNGNERELLDHSISKAAQAIIQLLDTPIQRVMNELNQSQESVDREN